LEQGKSEQARRDRGDISNDAAGSSVSNAGDVNGDGIDDFIVGARGVNAGATGCTRWVPGISSSDRPGPAGNDRPGRPALTVCDPPEPMAQGGLVTAHRSALDRGCTRPS
jgi:hypothetical protein